MSLPAYHRDGFLKVLDTVVVDAGEDDGRPYAVLEDTVFYPEGGGQPADHGVLGNADVIDVQKIDGEIRHYLSQPVERGPVRLELDWRRRWDHMQQHTAQHVLTAVALQQFNWRTTALHLGPVISEYLHAVEDGLGSDAESLHVMTSAGGLVGADSYRSMDSLLSGPAGGVVLTARRRPHDRRWQRPVDLG
jgi:hypothetical protein